MKYIILFALALAACLAGNSVNDSRYEILNIEGCQYIVINNANGSGITHKANCHNPYHKEN